MIVQAQSMLRNEKAALTQKLLNNAKSQPQGPQAGGKIVNDFGQEEAGVSKRQQKQQVGCHTIPQT